MPVDDRIAIRAERLTREYPMGASRVHAVQDVSFEIPAGEFAALLGSSGSGKSTLLNLMAGLDRPTSGAVYALGRNLAEMTSQELAAHRNRTVGMVFQSFNLLPRMTLEENIELPLRLAEMDRAERARRVREAAERVHLSARLTHRPTELSGGEQQRAAVARAVANRPAILLADEPTGNLDSATGDEIMRLLSEINSTLGTTIVLVTHERERARQHARRLLFLRDGCLSVNGERP